MNNRFFALNVLIRYNTLFENKMTNKIEFTDNAKREINRIISQDTSKKYFRISVLGGGCLKHQAYVRNPSIFGGGG